MDGKVVIGTEIDDSGFDDGVKDLENKADKDGSKVGGAFSQAFSKATSFGKGLLNVVGKIAKSILDITSVAGLIGATLGGATLGALTLRGALQKVFQENEQVKANIQYIVFAINKALEPAINKVAEIIVKIINLLLKAMQYTAYLIKMWTGKNIFDGANADAFSKSMQEGAKDSKKIAKNMKEAGNQTAKFDEMNILQDNSSSGGGADIGAGGGIGAMPTIDLSNLEDVEIPKWLQWIAENGNLVKDIIIGIGVAIASLKISELLQSLGLFGELPLWQLVLGISLILAGLILTIQGIVDFIKDPSWENFLTILQGISLVVAGIAVLMGGWLVALVAVGVAIVATIMKYWDEIKGFLDKGFKWLEDSIGAIGNTFGSIIAWAYDIFIGSLKLIMLGLNDIFAGVKKIFNGIIQFVTGVFTGDWKKAWEGVKQIFSGLFQSIVGIAKSVLGMVMAVATSIAVAIGSAIVGTIKAVINSVLSTIEGTINGFFSLINGAIKLINKIPGVNISKIQLVKFPRLAKGGIVNMPGRGVNYGGAYIGERAPEGVIPLTDSQQMALLGEAIGKYITINATITNTMNGRVISRELQKINNENDFAFNR